MLSKIKIN